MRRVISILGWMIIAPPLLAALCAVIGLILALDRVLEFAERNPCSHGEDPADCERCWADRQW